MTTNVGSRKRSRTDESTSAAAKRQKPQAVRRFRRTLRPFGDLGGYGMARMDQAVVFGRKFDRPVTFKKTSLASILWTGAGSYIGNVGTFRANEIPDWANIKTLFSHYKFERIKLVFTLIDNVAGDSKAFNNTRMPKLFIRQNDDPSLTSPTTVAAFQDYSNVLSFQLTPERTRVEFIVDPKMLAPLAITPDNVNQGYTTVKPPYIKVIDDNVPVYGWHAWIDYLDSSFRVLVDIEYDIKVKSDQ